MDIILHKDFPKKTLAFQLISFGFHWHWNIIPRGGRCPVLNHTRLLKATDAAPGLFFVRGAHEGEAVPYCDPHSEGAYPTEGSFLYLDGRHFPGVSVWIGATFREHLNTPTELMLQSFDEYTAQRRFNDAA